MCQPGGQLRGGLEPAETNQLTGRAVGYLLNCQPAQGIAAGGGWLDAVGRAAAGVCATAVVAVRAGVALVQSTHLCGK